MHDPFVATLTARRDAAKKRVEKLLEEAQRAEEEAATWEAALVAELSKGEQGYVATFVRPPATDLTGVRTKEELIRRAIEIHAPVKSSKLIEILAPTVSAAHIYYTLAEMKKTGRVTQMPDKRYVLAEVKTQAEK